MRRYLVAVQTVHRGLSTGAAFGWYLRHLPPRCWRDRFALVAYGVEGVIVAVGKPTLGNILDGDVWQFF